LLLASIEDAHFILKEFRNETCNIKMLNALLILVKFLFFFCHKR